MEGGGGKKEGRGKEDGEKKANGMGRKGKKEDEGGRKMRKMKREEWRKMWERGRQTEGQNKMPLSPASSGLCSGMYTKRFH